MQKKLSKYQMQQAMAAANPNLQVVQNGGVTTAVNFAIEDFYKAAMVMKRATKQYTVPWVDLPQGLRLFVQQQFFRLNGAGLLLDALGFQSVTEVMVVIHQDASDYMQRTMAGWNEVIKTEGDVERMFAEIAEEEKAQANPPQAMQ